MQPESSDGFASVGTILPEEGAALLPGGSFRFEASVRARCLSSRRFRGSLSPFVPARLAFPRIASIDTLEGGIFGAAFWTPRQLEFGRLLVRFVDDLLRNRLRRNQSRELQLVGGY